MSAHTFVLKIEDGYVSWSLRCPEDGSCRSSRVCGQCGRDVLDAETEPCYDCPKAASDGCWAQTWVGNVEAEEVMHGTVEVTFPVDCQWNGDGLEAHVLGPAPVSK